MTLSGSCLCGDVRFEIEGPLGDPAPCHCSMCRKAHGAPFVTWMAASPGDFRWRSGAEGIRRFEVLPGSFRPFCGRCGSSVPNQPEGMNRVFVPGGLLDGDP